VEDKGEAVRAIEQTEAQRGLVVGRWPAIRTVVREVEKHRDGNHFGQRIADAYKETFS